MKKRDQLKKNSYTESIRWNMDITSFPILFKHLEITADSNLLNCLLTLVSFVELVYKLRASKLFFITFHIFIALRLHLFVNLASMLLLYLRFRFLGEDTFSRHHLSNQVSFHKTTYCYSCHRVRVDHQLLHHFHLRSQNHQKYHVQSQFLSTQTLTFRHVLLLHALLFQKFHCHSQNCCH